MLADVASKGWLKLPTEAASNGVMCGQVLSNTASADLRKDTPVPSPLLPARKRGVEDAHVPDTVSPLSSTKNLLGSASGADSKGVCGTSIISDQMDYVHLR